MTETDYQLHKTAWDYFVLTQYDGYKYRNKEEDERKKTEGTHPCVDEYGKLRPEYIAFNKANSAYYHARQKAKRDKIRKEQRRKYCKKWNWNAGIYFVAFLALGIHTGMWLFYAGAALTAYLYYNGYCDAGNTQAFVIPD